MSHFNELTNCFLSLAHHQCFCLSSPFSSFLVPSFLCQSVLDIMFNFQCELMHGGHLSVKNYPLTEKVILETPFTPLYCNMCIPVDDFRCWERGTERFLSRCFDTERDSGRIPHLFLQGWLNFSINLSKWAVEREGLCIVLFSIYQICPLVLSS